MQYQPQISRRTVLRGLGVSLALPWMESSAWSSTLTGGSLAAGTPPCRLSQSRPA